MQDAPFTGFAVIDANTGRNYLCRSHKLLSSFRLEAFAILESLRRIREGDHEGNDYAIFSDSKSVLSATKAKFVPGRSNNIILEIKKSLKYLSDKGKKINLIWVPAHRGIIGSEITDMEAKRAVRDGLDSQFSVPINEIKNLWKEQLKTETST